MEINTHSLFCERDKGYEMNRIRSKISFVFSCIVGVILLAGCGAFSPSAIEICENYGEPGHAYEGMHLGSRDFDVPRGTYLCIDLAEPHSVFVVSKRQRIDLGELSYQFGEMPFKTIILKLSPKYHVITGLLDNDVEGFGLAVSVTHGGIGGGEGTKTTQPSAYKMLWIPIHELNFPNWETIRRSYISIDWGGTTILEEWFDPKVNVLEEAIPVVYP